jgi:putative flippase GtrA
MDRSDITVWMCRLGNIVERFFRFALVGMVSTSTYFLVFAGVINLGGSGAGLAASLAFAASTIVSYLGNAVWAFRSVVSVATSTRFLTIVGATFLVNLAVAVGLEAAGAHYLLIFAAEVVVLAGLNFLGHSIWTFRGVGADSA